MSICRPICSVRWPSQAEAEREKRAKIIHAAGELEASEKLAQAAAVIATEPVTITLRYLQTLTEIASEKNSTIIFPLPIELMNLLNERRTKGVSVPELTHDATEDGFHEIQLSGKQLVFLFMAATVVLGRRFPVRRPGRPWRPGRAR